MDGETPGAVRAFVQMFLDHQKQGPRVKFQFAVTLQSTGQLIGNCGVRRNSAEAHEGDMGYELDPDYWARDMLPKPPVPSCTLGFHI